MEKRNDTDNSVFLFPYVLNRFATSNNALSGCHMKILNQLMFLLIFHCQLIPVNAQLENRVALIIGIRAYEKVPPLQNSVNDAKDMSIVLKRKGFQAIELYDTKTKKELQDGVRSYYNLMQSKPNSIGLIYYSGHGMQVDGVNYLMPAAADPQIKADVDDQCLNMDYVMQAVEQANNALNIFIIDACRNNPFRSFSRSAEKGLSMVNAPKGSYIVYATKPGAVASDGTGKNGLFTSKLLKYIDMPGITLERVFKNVAADVSAESNDLQRPWISSDYTGDFYFSQVGEDVKNTSTPLDTKPDRVTSTPEQYFETAEQYLSQKVYSEALAWYRKAADLGNADAMNKVGEFYWKGLGVPVNAIEAVAWYKKALSKNNARAQANLGHAYYWGYGVSKDWQAAIEWYRKAAIQNDAEAQSSLAYMYLNGEGTDANADEAFNWYRRAAEQGNATAQVNIAFLYLNGKGVTKNEIESASWFRKAADQGEVKGISNLAYLYQLGIGVKQDYMEAARLYRVAGDLGDVFAQDYLGVFYLNGYGVPQDYAEAIKWFRKGEAKGYVFSLKNLAYMYEMGYGVERNKDEAIRLYRKAAEQGNEYAQERLKVLLN